MAARAAGGPPQDRPTAASRGPQSAPEREKGIQGHPGPERGLKTRFAPPGQGAHHQVLKSDPSPRRDQHDLPRQLLTEADLIIYGQGAVHAVCEISLSAGQDGLDQARRRADMLQEATGERVNAVVATPDPHPALVEAAGKLGVSVMDIPRRDA